jgi:hypothetical protein
MSNPAAPRMLASLIPSSRWVRGPPSTAWLHGGLVAAAVQASVKTDKGMVVIYDADKGVIAEAPVGCPDR